MAPSRSGSSKADELVVDDGDRFTDAWDALDPFDPTYPHLWIKIEHLGRYLFAASFLSSIRADTVLDAGCGRGYGAAELATTCTQLLAVDADETLLRSARQAYPAPNIRYLRATIGTGHMLENVSAGSLDAVVCFETLEHLIDPARALQEFHEMTRPGGTLILSVPNAVYEGVGDGGLLTNTSHRRRYSTSSINELLARAGFEITEVLGQPLTNMINANETRLIRRKQTDCRIGDEPALHDPAVVRRMARAIGYPEQRDIELSYSIIVVAHRTNEQTRSTVELL